MAKTAKKILIVDDDKDFLNILKIKFESEGFLVATASNAEEGVGVAEKEKPSLLISDVLMSPMDGIEMARRIRELNKKVSVIFLTNTKDGEHTSEAEKLDDAEYLIKSDLMINDIVDAVKKKLKIK